MPTEGLANHRIVPQSPQKNWTDTAKWLKTVLTVRCNKNADQTLNFGNEIPI